MDNQKLNRLNSIKEEIEELESFIRTAEHVWTGKIIKQTNQYIFKAVGCGRFDSKEFNLNNKIKNKVLNVIKEYLEELKVEFESI